MLNLMGNFEGGKIETWEIAQEVKRLESKIDHFSDKIFDAKMEKRSSAMYETLKREYIKKLNYLTGCEF